MQRLAECVRRLEVVVEQNKVGSWSVATYLVTDDGKRYRRGLATFPSCEAARASLTGVWQEISLSEAA